MDSEDEGSLSGEEIRLGDLFADGIARLRPDASAPPGGASRAPAKDDKDRPRSTEP